MVWIGLTGIDGVPAFSGAAFLGRLPAFLFILIRGRPFQHKKSEREKFVQKSSEK
jgi:hypothetical protein